MTNLNDLHAASRAAGATLPPTTAFARFWAGYKRGDWLTAADATYLNLSPAERFDILLNHPSRRALAGDWNFTRGVAFERYAMACDHNGWSVFPEETNKDAKRKPAFLSKGKTKYQVKPTERYKRRPGTSLIAWEADLGTVDFNVAMTCCEASSNARVLDIDVRDEKLADEILAVAFKIFGPTPFVRIGSFPKRALIYRVDGDAIKFPTRSVSFLGDDGKRDFIESANGFSARNAIEFLAQGHNLTIYGRHHKTGKSFDWSEGKLHPAIAGPEMAPVITKAQLNAFFAAAEQVRAFDRGSAHISTSNPKGQDVNFSDFDDVNFDPNCPIHLPAIFSTGPWTQNADGAIIDGREMYLTKMVWAACAANARLLTNPSTCLMVKNALTLRVSKAVHESGRWVGAIERETNSKFENTVAKWLDSIRNFERTGSYIEPCIPWQVHKGNTPFKGTRAVRQHAPIEPRPADHSLDWLPAVGNPIFAELSDRTTLSISIDKKSLAEIKSDKETRAILPDAKGHTIGAGTIQSAQRKTSDSVVRELGVIRRSVSMYNKDPEGEPPLHILVAPPGSGKTVKAIEMAAEDCKANPRGPGTGPIFVILPNHSNIAEALDTASSIGIDVPSPQSEIDEDEAVVIATSMGLKATIFRGKVLAGCQRVEELKRLEDAKIGASGLCSAKVDIGDEMDRKRAREAGEKVEREEILCPIRASGDCGYWKQADEVRDADIVFLPHAYLFMHALPAALKNPRMVIVDESVTFAALKQANFPLEILHTPRPAPWLTKAEKAGLADIEGKQHQLLDERLRASDIVVKALSDRKCPSQSIIDAGAEASVDAAIKVLMRSKNAEREVRPDLADWQLAEIVNRPQGQHLIEEERFWRLIFERIELIKSGVATGEVDARIQLLRANLTGLDGAEIRISWRSTPNWQDVPTILLDASADPRITKKIFGREPIVHRVEARQHLRTVAVIDSTYSNSLFSPPSDAGPKVLEAAKEALYNSRRLINKIGAIYSHGQVLAGSTKNVRGLLQDANWAPPPNVEFGHFGALRGLDFAKGYVAAVSVGRTEQPISVVDGYAAALTYDDHQPERPFDLTGAGVDWEGKPVRKEKLPRKIQLRSGKDVTHYVPAYAPGTWAQAIENQWREEELTQFVGRLRPVYRTGEPPVWIAVSSILPDGIIVDDVVAMKDLVKDHQFWSLLRRTDGILAPEIVDADPALKKMVGDDLGKWASDQLQQNPEFMARFNQTFRAVKYQRASGEAARARVLAWHDDALAAVTEKFAAIGIDVESAGLELYKFEVEKRFIERRHKRKADALDLLSAAAEVKSSDPETAPFSSGDIRPPNGEDWSDLDTPTRMMLDVLGLSRNALLDVELRV